MCVVSGVGESQAASGGKGIIQAGGLRVTLYCPNPQFMPSNFGTHPLLNYHPPKL